MSKRKRTATDRQSKRHKSHNYDDGKTDLQREMELYEQTQQQQQDDEFYRAQQALQRQQAASSITTTNNNTNSSNIQLGTPISEDDEDEDDDIDQGEEYQASHIRDDSESDYHEEDKQQISDYSTNHTKHSKSETETQPQALPSPHKETEITLHDLRAAQMKRSQLEKICTEPFFADFIGRSRIPIPGDDEYEHELPGLFCRIYIGDRETSSGSREPIYRICEMISIEDWKRAYTLTDNRTTISHGLLIAHGRNERVFKIVQTSNSPFTQKEFQQWKQTMRDDGIVLPTKDELSTAYLNAIKRHKNFKYDANSIALMREKKNKNFNARQLANPHKEKLRITTIISGLQDDDTPQVAQERMRYERYLTEINMEIERRNSISSAGIKVSIASINEKNKIKNKKLMLKAREKERKFQLKMRGLGQKQCARDPFTRAITAPKIESFNSNLPAISMEDVGQGGSDGEVVKQENRKKENSEEVDLDLSILEDHNKYNSNKGLVSGGMEVGVGVGIGLCGDVLWSNVVNVIAKDFVLKCQNIDLDLHADDGDGDCQVNQPQFGRNTNRSKYGNRFTKKPRGLQIISIDEYLKTKKYSAM